MIKSLGLNGLFQAMGMVATSPSRSPAATLTAPPSVNDRWQRPPRVPPQLEPEREPQLPFSPPPEQTSDGVDLLRFLAVLVGIRAVVFAAGVLALALGGWQYHAEWATGTPWLAYDSMHYIGIIVNGYAAPEIPQAIAFFPAYPLMVKAAMLVVPGLSVAAAMLVVSNLCAVAGLAFAYDWARRVTDRRTAKVGMLLLVTFPAAVFFCGGLTEGPFLLGLSFVLWSLQRKMLWPAVAACAVMSIMRPTGVAVAATVALWTLLCHRPETPLARRLALAFAVGVMAVGGLIAYEGYLWHRYGRWDAYFVAQRTWDVATDQMHAAAAEAMAGRSTAWAKVEYYFDKLLTPQAWNRAMMWVVVGVSLVGLLKSRAIPRVLFVVPLWIFLMAYLPGWGTRASSVVRYESVCAMVFLLPAVWLVQAKAWRATGALLAAQFAVQLYYATLFSRGQWVG